jgi:hypothetical protein
VLARYRDFTVARLRRHLGLPPETPVRAVTERLRDRQRVSSLAIALLERGGEVHNEKELYAVLTALDRLVWEVTR